MVSGIRCGLINKPTELVRTFAHTHFLSIPLAATRPHYHHCHCHNYLCWCRRRPSNSLAIDLVYNVCETIYMQEDMEVCKSWKKTSAALCKELIIQSCNLFFSSSTMNKKPATIVAENSNKLINHTAWRITKCEYDLHFFVSPVRVCNMHASNNIKTTIFRSENNSKPNKNQSTQQMARNDESKWKKLHHILIFIFGHFITLMPTLYLSIYWYGFCCVRGQHFAC